MSITSLLFRKSPIALPQAQWTILNGGAFAKSELPFFERKLAQHQIAPLRSLPLEILQLNLGYSCNQACAHCHVDAAPDRKEMMQRQTMEHCLAVIEKTKVPTIDLTGGAPEMNPHFRWLVAELAARDIKDIIVRSNLTILLAHKSYADLPDFFAQHKVHIVSSLPFYKREKTDRQRGNGTFDQSIEALRRLNRVGYGLPDSPLRLDLVYNPAGAFLPTDQSALERDFKTALLSDFGIHFHNLFALTNLPISRFLEYLLSTDNYEEYMQTLVTAFNPAATAHLMCRNTLSVGWDGQIYDCDFNQMLQLPVAAPIQHISQYSETALENRPIVVSQHCYGCTAGAGSSCQGSLV